MAHIKESVHVRIARDSARQRLCGMLVEGAHGEAAQALLLAVKIPWTGIELSKEVDVEYSVPFGPSHNEEPIGVRWTPTAGGIYPSFDGELRVLPGNHADTSVLELVGHYTPPLGVLGIGFDAAFGHRVAEATMKYLLEGLASGVVARDHTAKWQEVVSVSHTSHVRVIKGTCIVERPMLPPPVS